MFLKVGNIKHYYLIILGLKKKFAIISSNEYFNISNSNCKIPF